jgi:hypothetical protein
MKPHNKKELNFVITAAIKIGGMLFIVTLFLFLLTKILNL